MMIISQLGVYWLGQKSGGTKGTGSSVTLTELRQLDKIKVSKRAKEDTARALVGQMMQWQPCQYCGRVHPPRQCQAYGKMCGVWQDGTFQESMPQQKK